ncbi:MAG: KUP/HAK/KT family potassium transporter, partial [Bacteroidetes bacterium]|nr:KUP/HAK/KT family potassium transporter [Bacteroidota bacterium]
MPLHKTQSQPLTWAGMVMTLGIVFGDIGTSPLYVFRAIVGATGPITEELVLGGLSCIFWTLTILTTFKYVLILLRADNRGEGGVFSLYALVRRYGKWLWLPTIIGAATLLADSIMTPSISVASAVEGLSGVKAFAGIIEPGNTQTVTVVVIIISLLFFFQRFGTQVVGFSFGPIMLVWFTMLILLGVPQILHNPHVLASINPIYGWRLLTQHPGGFWLLGAVFLCTTGAEGLYNDLGHCGRKNISTTWVFVKTALVCNYMGQGAWLLKHQGMDLGDMNPFFELMPPWFRFVGVGIATLAAIVACQALISGSFTLINEAITLNFWPRIRVKFPTEVRGQIYIPGVNWLLWAGCMGVMAYFRSSDNMETAYGFFILVAMLMTTVLLFGYLRFVRHWHLWMVLPLIGLFFTVELANLVANAVKILHYPLLLVGVVLVLGVMFIWFRARKIVNSFIQFVPLTD